MISFMDALEGSYRNSVYNFILKTVVPPDEFMLFSLKSHLTKYKLLAMSKAEKSIIHKNPKDFGHLSYAEVYIIRFSVAYPVSPEILHREIVTIWKLPYENVVVKTEEDVRELDDEAMNKRKELEKKAKEMGLQPSSLLSYGYYGEYETPVPQELMAGNKFVEKFKEIAAKELLHKPVKKYRSPETDKLFSWLLDKEEEVYIYDTEQDFNKDIKDAPRVYTDKSKTDEKENEMFKNAEKEIIGQWGSYVKKGGHWYPAKDEEGRNVEVFDVPDALKILKDKYKKN